MIDYFCELFRNVLFTFYIKNSLNFSFNFHRILGLSYVGRDPATGKEDWSGCANIKLYIFENTKKYNNYVDSFNLQTNLWVLKYVYKRLKFLGNRNISHLSALLFLAVWHGFHSGYYMTFFLEFMVIHFEKQVYIFFKYKFIYFVENFIFILGGTSYCKESENSSHRVSPCDATNHLPLIEILLDCVCRLVLDSVCPPELHQMVGRL